MTPRPVLLPSPLLGPVTWSRVAIRLRERGHDPREVPDLGPVATPEDVLAGFLAAVPADEPVVLVPHSNAGLYVAALAARRNVAAVLFVDALLPGPGPTTPTTSPGMRAWLAGLADGTGRLPPWTRWWPAEDVAALGLDGATLAEVRAAEPRLPLAYFDADVPTPPGWDERPAAYLALGDAYAEERAEAARRGWPVETLPGGHLHPLVDPAAVTDAVVRLAGHLAG